MVLASVERSAGACPACYGRPLASRRVLEMLAPTLTAAAGKTTHRFRTSSTHSEHACENFLWGAPRIHGELLKLGFTVSERTVSRYLSNRHTVIADVAYILRKPSRRPDVQLGRDVGRLGRWRHRLGCVSVSLSSVVSRSECARPIAAHCRRNSYARMRPVGLGVGKLHRPTFTTLPAQISAPAGARHRY